MTLSARPPAIEIVYPDGDGQPMSESDPTRDYLIYAVSTLDLFFRDRPDVYVSGNLFIYYKQGLPDAVVSPDCFVIFGVEKKKRRSYKVWEEGGKLPSFILEITSKTTQENDELEKPGKYQRMGVLEYFQYDPTGDYLQPALKGSRLVQGEYQPIPRTEGPDGAVVLYSESLGLELRLLPDGQLRFYDPQTGQRLMDHAETDRARLESEQARSQAEQARSQAEQARSQAEQARQAAIPRLLEMGLSVEQVAIALGLTVQEVEAAR